MSDALTTDSALATASQDSGQPGQASAEAQAETPKQDTKKVNLHDLPEYREVQSKMDRERAQLQQALQREQQARLDMQRRLEALEDRAAPDDFTRLENQLRRKEAEIASYQQQIRAVQEQQQIAAERDKALTEIAQEFDVPRSVLEEAIDYKHAAKLALAHIAGVKQKKQQEDEERRERNKPDIGGGKTNTPLSRLERDYEEARARRDSQEMIRLERELRRSK